MLIIPKDIHTEKYKMNAKTTSFFSLLFSSTHEMKSVDLKFPHVTRHSLSDKLHLEFFAEKRGSNDYDIFVRANARVFLLSAVIIGHKIPAVSRSDLLPDRPVVLSSSKCSSVKVVFREVECILPRGIILSAGDKARLSGVDFEVDGPTATAAHSILKWTGPAREFVSMEEGSSEPVPLVNNSLEFRARSINVWRRDSWLDICPHREVRRVFEMPKDKTPILYEDMVIGQSIMNLVAVPYCKRGRIVCAVNTLFTGFDRDIFAVRAFFDPEEDEAERLLTTYLPRIWQKARGIENGVPLVHSDIRTKGIGHSRICISAFPRTVLEMPFDGPHVPAIKRDAASITLLSPVATDDQKELQYAKLPGDDPAVPLNPFGRTVIPYRGKVTPSVLFTTRSPAKFGQDITRSAQQDGFIKGSTKDGNSSKKWHVKVHRSVVRSMCPGLYSYCTDRERVCPFPREAVAAIVDRCYGGTAVLSPDAETLVETLGLVTPRGRRRCKRKEATVEDGFDADADTANALTMDTI